jgi:hypothetical protein
MGEVLALPLPHPDAERQHMSGIISPRARLKRKRVPLYLLPKQQTGYTGGVQREAVPPGSAGRCKELNIVAGYGQSVAKNRRRENV